ncbi:AP-3 complex subunit beta-2-like [Oscarella lobularis]|uniref:AP-3 complex subunit beta-2-like n=1 Tax=Oscarella lobularis TaxID=121494 RepID=UPI003313AE4F
MAGVSGTPYSMEGGHSSSSFSAATVDVDRDMTGGFFSSDQTRLEELKKMLDGNKDGQKLESMKRIIGMIAKGRNVSALFPAVVKNVVSKNPEIKKLVYVYLMRYAEEEPDLALLSISTFQKALKDPNQLIRASALRVLSSIRVPVIVPIMMLALKECVTDMSAFVRKTVAHAIPTTTRAAIFRRRRHRNDRESTPFVNRLILPRRQVASSIRVRRRPISNRIRLVERRAVFRRRRLRPPIPCSVLDS